MRDLLQNGSAMTWVLILGVILVLLLVWFLLKAVNQKGRQRKQSPEEKSLEILKGRYTRGEISEEEYERRRNSLR